MMSLFIASLVVSAVGALASLCACKREGVAKALGCVIGAVAAAMTLVVGVASIVGTRAIVSADALMFTFSLRLDPLSGVLLTIVSALALAAWIYGLSYFDEYAGKGIGAMCFFMNAFVASMELVVTVDNVFWFLFFFEMMSLTSYFLVVTEQTDASIKGGFVYLVMAHVGFFLIMVSFLVMAAYTGSFEFSAFRATQFPPAVAGLAFTLAFLGFGTKAGMVPLHSWLPMAHPAAPSNVSALMSGGMIKIGVFGILFVGFDLLGSSGVALWWGVMVLLFGAVSSVLGGTYALGEHDMKRLLAYHSVENIGIILLGVGVALVGAATDNAVLTVLGLLAALFHIINHAMFKGLLFLGAGSVLYSVHTRNMELMGGLSRVMPVTAACFLIGSLAISAIPPLNGFVSEWFTYQGLITGAMGAGAGAGLKIVLAFCVVSLAVTGALAVTCFVKAYGVSFLGNPRSDAARDAREVPAPMKLSMVLLAAVCCALGIGSPWIVPGLTGAAAQIGSAALVQTATGVEVVNPATGSAMSAPLVAILLLGCVFLVWAICRAKSTGGVTNAPDPWACGYNPTPDMAPLATSVASSIRMFWGPLYDIRDALCGRNDFFRDLFSRISSWANKAQNWGDVALVEPTGNVVTRLANLSGKLEGGDFRVYILYIVVTLVVFLAIAVAVV